MFCMFKYLNISAICCICPPFAQYFQIQWWKYCKSINYYLSSGKHIKNDFKYCMKEMLPNLNVIFISPYSYYAGNNVSVIKLKHIILFILDVVLQLVPENTSRDKRDQQQYLAVSSSVSMMVWTLLIWIYNHLLRLQMDMRMLYLPWRGLLLLPTSPAPLPHAGDCGSHIPPCEMDCFLFLGLKSRKSWMQIGNFLERQS